MATSKAGTKGRLCQQSPGGRAADRDLWELNLERRCSHQLRAMPKAESKETHSGVSSLPALQSPPMTSIGQTQTEVSFPAKKPKKGDLQESTPCDSQQSGLDVRQMGNSTAHMAISPDATVSSSVQSTHWATTQYTISKWSRAGGFSYPFLYLYPHLLPTSS